MCTSNIQYKNKLSYFKDEDDQVRGSLSRLNITNTKSQKLILDNRLRKGKYIWRPVHYIVF